VTFLLCLKQLLPSSCSISHASGCLFCWPIYTYLENPNPSSAFFCSWGTSSTSHGQLAQRKFSELTGLLYFSLFFQGWCQNVNRHSFILQFYLPFSTLVCSISQASYKCFSHRLMQIKGCGWASVAVFKLFLHAAKPSITLSC
jgi:hypothetical protein